MIPVPITHNDDQHHRRLISQALRELSNGKINSVGSVTLTASSATTVVVDHRVGGDSKIFFTPTDALAAAEFGAGGMYVSAKGKGTFTITNANTSGSRSFDYAVFG